VKPPKVSGASDRSSRYLGRAIGIRHADQRTRLRRARRCCLEALIRDNRLGFELVENRIVEILSTIRRGIAIPRAARFFHLPRSSGASSLYRAGIAIDGCSSFGAKVRRSKAASASGTG
jgi:hypothetical protein